MNATDATDKIAVIGSGAWGTTLAVLLARHGRHVWLWTRTAEEAQQMAAQRENRRFLPGVPLPDAMTISADVAETVRGAALVLMVAPSQKMRANAAALRDHLDADTLLLSCSKGFEMSTLKRMSEVIAEELPDHRDSIGALSGPNIAREIAAGLPASTVVALADTERAERARALINAPDFRTYIHDDLLGVEVAGALKNIIAIGAGAADELALGDNAKSSYLTRGLAEIARLGTAAGANPLTFTGLAGLGDLLCTCASPHSRNHFVGVELAKGRTLEDIRASMTHIAEGVYTVQTARELAARYNVEMPIADQLHLMLYEGKSVPQVLRDLMTRDPKAELDGLRHPLAEWDEARQG